MYIDGPQYSAFWKDSSGHPWWMEWTNVGPIWSRDAFLDGGCDFNIIPMEILIATEQWALAVLGKRIMCSADLREAEE